MDDCLQGEEQAIYGDKAYANETRKQAAEENGIDWRVNRKAKRGKKLNCADRSFNKKSNRVRSHVEPAFGIVKHLWGYRKVRYRGLDKNAAQVFTLFALANFYKVRHELLTGQDRTCRLIAYEKKVTLNQYTKQCNETNNMMSIRIVNNIIKNGT